jgi:hypothetical protein
MNYLPALREFMSAQGLGDLIWLLIEHSLVRAKLDPLGYRTVAFETGYRWSEFSTADIYLGRGRDPLSLQMVTPFEAMLVKTTTGLLLLDGAHMIRDQSNQNLLSGLDAIEFPHQAYVEGQMYILDTLPATASIEGPTFVFTHLLIPHVPRVFDPRGGLLTDPGYYGGELAGAVNDEYDRPGYISEIQFINRKLLEITDRIISASEAPR